MAASCCIYRSTLRYPQNAPAKWARALGVLFLDVPVKYSIIRGSLDAA